MKRSKGLAGQMAEQMHVPKNAAKGMLATAKKMNDRDGFMGGGTIIKRQSGSKVGKPKGWGAARYGNNKTKY